MHHKAGFPSPVLTLSKWSGPDDVALYAAMPAPDLCKVKSKCTSSGSSFLPCTPLSISCVLFFSRVNIWDVAVIAAAAVACAVVVTVIVALPLPLPL